MRRSLAIAGRRRVAAGVVLGVLWLSASPPLTAEPSGEDIIARALETFYYGGKDERVHVAMKLINAQGSVRERDLTMLRLNVGDKGEQRYYIFFHSPADVKGTAFMVWKYPRAEDDRWIYIPAINLVKRIAADDKRASFVGSDFTYEDVSGRDIGDETHRLLRQEMLDGRPTFVVESKPKQPIDYVRRVAWIDAERWLPLKEEYHDARGQLLRVFAATKVERIDGVWTATGRTMTDRKTGHRTDVELTQVEYGVGLDADVFTERYLRRPPTRWIRR